MRYDELLLKRFGAVPVGIEKIADRSVYLYNPDNLPGIHEVAGGAFEMTENGPKLRQPCLANLLEILIDEKLYAVAIDGFADGDYEGNCMSTGRVIDC